VTHDPFSYWRDALAGKPMQTEKGSPRSGYYRSQSGDEVVAIWYEPEGNVQCERSKYGNGSKMSADEIDELFGWICHYPISFELFEVAMDGGQLPPEYKTRLTTKEIQGGVTWTPEIGKRKLALDPERYDEDGNERASIGHNNPPEDLTPDAALAKRIHDLGVQLGAWLAGIGGTPRNEAEAEILSGYANKFKDFENEAVAAHKAEKAPHLEKCREIDGKWFGPVKDKAIACRDKIIGVIRAWEKSENDRRAEAARLANEAARKAAEQAAVKTDEAPAPVPEFVPEPTKVSTLRGGGKRPSEKLIIDLKAFFAYAASLNEPPPDLIDAAEKVARKWKAAGIKAPGMVTAQQKEVA
jgi:hypothetical protein